MTVDHTSVHKVDKQTDWFECLHARLPDLLCLRRSHVLHLMAVESSAEQPVTFMLVGFTIATT